MRVFAASTLVLALLLPLNARPADTASALAVYKNGDFERAIPLLQAAVAAAPQDPELNAALLSSLVYQGQVDAASDAATADEEKFPDVPAVIAARGEFAYYMGDMEKAETLFRKAIKLKEQTPRAYLGLYRLYQAASMYRTARRLILRAHAIDPDDALITRNWMSFIPPEQQLQLFGPFVDAHPWLFKGLKIHRVATAKVSEEVKRRTAFELEGGAREITLNLIPIYNSRREVQAVGLPFTLNNGHKLTLILDTGASGILLDQSAVNKTELNHLGTLEATGIGDGGGQRAFAAVSGTCAIGTLHYKTCLIRAAEGELHLTGDADGLIGTNLFSNYLVEIDFRKYKLHLTPLPPGEPNPEGYDSKGPGDGWTRVFRYGHLLFAPTNLNGKTSGLFLIDTGAVMSNVDSTFARLATKVHNKPGMRVHGVSGDVKDVLQADKAVITFAGYRQKNIGITAFNLNSSAEHHDVRIDGILGFSVLDMFRLTLDYRNGLAKFEYTRK